MPIIQLVPCTKTSNNWWKKTIFEEFNGTEYVFNISIININKSTFDIDSLREKATHLLEKMSMKHSDFSSKKVDLNHHPDDDIYNLEFKFGEIPFVVKLNIHLKCHIDSGQYIPPSKRVKLTTIEDLLNLTLNDYFKDFILQWESNKEKLLKIEKNNCYIYDYRVANSSLKYTSGEPETESKTVSHCIHCIELKHEKERLETEKSELLSFFNEKMKKTDEKLLTFQCTEDTIKNLEDFKSKFPDCRIQ